MKIIISPAKKMNYETDLLDWSSLPIFLDEATQLMEYLKGLSYQSLKQLWNCNDKIAQLNYLRLQKMDLQSQLTPAVLSYEGLQYQYMAPQVMNRDQLHYIGDHLRILSGFYGMLRPFDGITPYRLEMQSKLIDFSLPDLYTYWGHKLFNQLAAETDTVINMATKEYSKTITPYNHGKLRIIDCVFGQIIDGKVKEKGTLAKMARGEMVRYLSQIQAASPEDIKSFHELGYAYSKAHSKENTYVFVKGETEKC